MDIAGWSRDLAVEVGGRGVINHAGSAAVRVIADRTGLTDGLSRAVARRGFTPVHDRSRVVTDTAVLIAGGGRVLSDMATLRDQAELYGPVASDPTLWRTLDQIGEAHRRKIAARLSARPPPDGLVCGSTSPSRCWLGSMTKNSLSARLTRTPSIGG